jgi:hypothetical protein
VRHPLHGDGTVQLPAGPLPPDWPSARIYVRWDHLRWDQMEPDYWTPQEELTFIEPWQEQERDVRIY